MQKKVPYVAQLGNMDCSIACMTMLFRYYGLDVDIVDVGQVVHIGRDGVNLTQLKQATQQFGFKCTAYRYNKQKNILDSNLPAVVYSGSHLAVIGSKTVLGQYILLDPIKGKSIVNFEQIHDTFSDILITIRPEKRIKRKKCKPKLKVAINYKLVAGIISLMLLIQALTLSIPLVEQALIDSITQSQSLLNSAYILVGCIVIAGLYFFLSIARQKLMLRLDISFVKEIMTKMLKKLFDIDPSFFEWHAVGEIVNRFSNVQAINNIIINTFSQVAVQIITSTICLVTMFVYSPSLSVITIAIGTIELVLLLGINKKNREDTSKYIADQSNMQGLLAEAIGNGFQLHRIRPSFFHRADMFPLDIGIHHVDDGLVVINIPHLHLNFVQPCKLRCMKASVPGDDLIATLGAGAHRQVCKYAVFLDAVHQLLHIFIVTHLERVIDKRMQLGKRHFRNKVAAHLLALCL